jgi:electron transport complex protein RnfD
MPFLDANILKRPQVNLTRSGPARMWAVSVVAACACVYSALSDGGASCLTALFCVAGAAAGGLLFCAVRKTNRFGDGSDILTGFILALLLPGAVTPVVAFVGGFFAVAVVKQSYGGLGSNWLNPALGGWLLIRAAWPGLYQTAAETHSVMLSPELSPAWEKCAVFLNEHVFARLNVNVGAGYFALFAGGGPGIIADRALCILIPGVIFLLAFQAFKLWKSVVFIVIISVCSEVAHSLGLPPSTESDILYNLFTGGTVVTAFFLINEPSSSPKSSVFDGLCAAAAAFLAWIFRYCLNETYGAITAVAVVNLAVPLLRKIETTKIYNVRAPKRSVPETEAEK